MPSRHRGRTRKNEWTSPAVIVTIAGILIASITTVPFEDQVQSLRALDVSIEIQGQEEIDALVNSITEVAERDKIESIISSRRVKLDVRALPGTIPGSTTEATVENGTRRPPYIQVQTVNCPNGQGQSAEIRFYLYGKDGEDLGPANVAVDSRGGIVLHGEFEPDEVRVGPADGRSYCWVDLYLQG